MQAHSFNRSAFFKVDGASPLLVAYSRLVALELALKDNDAANFAKGHDVCEMLRGRGDAQLEALAHQLSQALAALPCSDPKGNAAFVRPSKYPDVRYLRHQLDFSRGAKDESIALVLSIVSDVWRRLHGLGVDPC